MSTLDALSVISALDGSIYSATPAVAGAIASALNGLHERVNALRYAGKLSDDTLRRYYGQKRYESVAESNALEGSTLDISETKLAVEKGTTLTEHDPAYVRDAIALHRALVRLEEMAKDQSTATNFTQVKDLHALILAGRPDAGLFRRGRVTIVGATHRPPKTWEAVMSAMEDWERWSIAQHGAPPVLRAAVLHAWLAHIHPFSDGNGRTARAVSTLEMVRSGYPPDIIRRTQERHRYITALAESDTAGDIGAFFDLFIDRTEAALIGLENAAREMEGYSLGAVKVRQAQERRLVIWNTSIKLLYEVLFDKLASVAEEAGMTLSSHLIADALALDDYLALCNGRPISKSWAFEIKISAPGLKTIRRLAWVGYRSRELRNAAGEPDLHAPSLFWSKPNPDGYPQWTLAGDASPLAEEMSITPAKGDLWNVLMVDGQYQAMTLMELARTIADGLISLVSGD